MRDPVDHIARSVPPWRAVPNRTECGMDANTVKADILSREEFMRRWRVQGQRRTAMTTCMSCIETARRWKVWDEDPVSAVGRETYGSYGGRHADDKYAAQFRDELIALAELVERHRDEFAAILEGVRTTVRLDDVRRARRTRASGGSFTARD